MKKPLSLASVSIFILAVCVSLRADPPLPEGERLREIVSKHHAAGRVLVGATTGSWAFGTDQGVVLDREFGYVTPENDFKHSVIHPDPSSWNWSRADAWLPHIVEQGQVLRMHCPIGPQCSNWAKDDRRTPEELEEDLERFLKAVCQRYNGKPGIKYMDVVNEVAVGDGWHRAKPGNRWECPWYTIGQDSDQRRTPLFIRQAFEVAMRYAPDLKLVFNHHSPPGDPSWRLIKHTVKYLGERGLRVDAVGWQAHVEKGWDTEANLKELGQLIDWAQSHELEFHVTEASVWIKDKDTPAAREEQARTYAAILEAMLKKRSGGVVAWNTWHVSDDAGWRPRWKGALFDGAFKPKPAYYAIQRVLEARRY